MTSTELTRMELYLIRHCQAESQAPDAPLTPEGRTQAEALAAFLAERGVGRIVSSPFLRARQSIEPLARRLGVKVELDQRLVERVLTRSPIPDWQVRLRDSFNDLDLCLDGGESSRTAMARGVAAVQNAGRRDHGVVVVTHGNLLTLVLGHLDPRFDFDTWRALSNPDVFHLSWLGETVRVMRIWNENHAAFSCSC